MEVGYAACRSCAGIMGHIELVDFKGIVTLLCNILSNSYRLA